MYVLSRIGRIVGLSLGAILALWLALTLLIMIYAAFGGYVPDI